MDTIITLQVFAWHTIADPNLQPVGGSRMETQSIFWSTKTVTMTKRAILPRSVFCVKVRVKKLFIVLLSRIFLWRVGRSFMVTLLLTIKIPRSDWSFLWWILGYLLNSILLICKTWNRETRLLDKVLFFKWSKLQINLLTINSKFQIPL